MTDEMLKKIRQLPPLPESAINIERVYQDPDSSIKDMSAILEKDPLLMADILKSANSPLYGFSREIISISQAVSLFGMGTIRGFALASIVKKSFTLNLEVYNINNDSFSLLSSKLNALITAWLLRSNNKALGTLSAAAFLVEIGKAIIAQQVIAEKKEQEFLEAIKSGAAIEDVERELMGVDTPEVSSAIFEHWKFDPTLVNTVRHCLDPDLASDEIKPFAQMLQVVRTLFCLDGTIKDENIQKAKDLIKKYNLDLASFEKALENIA